MQNASDVEKAKVICEDVCSRVRYPCGNPIGGQWAPPASLMDGDMKTREFWEANGELCIRKGQANLDFERTREQLTEQNSRLNRLKAKIILQIRKDNQENPGLGAQHFFEAPMKKGWFSRMFPAFYNSCVRAASDASERQRICGYCGAVGGAKPDWASAPHADKTCATKRPQWKWVETKVEFERGIDPELEAMKQGDFIHEPDFKLAKFRCNDHAAILIQRLIDLNVEPPWDIVRMGPENRESQFHYFVVIGRDTGKPAASDGSIQPGEENPLAVLGKDAIILDPWSTKHDPGFSRFPLEKGGINFELEKSNKWFVAPRSFPGLYPLCRWPGSSSPDRAPQKYSGLGVGLKESVR